MFFSTISLSTQILLGGIVKKFRELIIEAAQHGIKVAQTGAAFQESSAFKAMTTAFSDEQRKILHEKMALDAWLKLQAELDAVLPVKAISKTAEPSFKRQNTQDADIQHHSDFEFDELLKAFDAWLKRADSIIANHNSLMQETAELHRIIDEGMETATAMRLVSPMELNPENVEQVRLERNRSQQQQNILSKIMRTATVHQNRLAKSYFEHSQAVMDGRQYIETAQQYTKQNKQNEARLAPKVEEMTHKLESFNKNVSQTQHELESFYGKLNLIQEVLMQLAQQVNMCDEFMIKNNNSSRAFEKPTPFSVTPPPYGLGSNKTSKKSEEDLYQQFKQPFSQSPQPFNTTPRMRAK